MAAVLREPLISRDDIPLWVLSEVRANVDRAIAEVWQKWAPPPKMTTREWADERLYLSPDAGTARPGKYNSDVTPWLRGIQDAMDDPDVQKVVCMKSSQIGWTVGCITAYVGRRIDIDPCPVVMMFPTADAAKEYNLEKFTPTVEVTPALADKVDVSSSRKSGNRATFKKFPGGFLKSVGSNSPRSVKSSSAPLLIVEEPDDASQDVKGQGDSIRLLEDRAKTYPRYKVIYGGTATIKGLSSVEWGYKNSDQRKLFVPCHHCGEEHVLDWENVHYLTDRETPHEIYGTAQPETAVYACPHCGGSWSDYEKNQNVRRACDENDPAGGWKATAPFNGVAGFGYISELYVHWPNSRLEKLVERYLRAKYKADNGDTGELIAFQNSTLGLPYEFGGQQLEADALAEQKGEDYRELVAPSAALVVTVGIDVQPDRFAIIIRAWGRDEESWLIHWGEIYGTVNDRADEVWQELERLVFGAFQHESGRELFARAVSIDSGDGNTNDVVYHWVREMSKKYRQCQVMAIKGASESATDKEIYSLPKKVDHRTPTKAAKFGLKVFIVGTNKAKDVILGGEEKAGRMRLRGHGPGRFHVYRDVRDDYWDHLTSEVKAPSRRHRNKLIWQKRAGRRNEALDCEVYALHAARAIKLHTLTPAHWEAMENRLRQSDLFDETAASQQPAENQQPVTAEPTGQPAQQRQARPRRSGGFVKGWRR